MITDHKDGSWTVTGNKDKKYLTKYLKSEGYRPHVHRSGDSRWQIGLSKDLAYKPKVRIQKAHKISHRQVAMRYQPRRSSSQGSPIGGRYVPLGRTRRYPRAYPRPAYHGRVPVVGSPSGPSGSGGNYFQRMMKQRAARQEQEKERKRQMLITDEKMRNERIQQERDQTAKQIREQENTRRLQQEHAQHEEYERTKREVEKLQPPPELQSDRENSVIGR